MGEVRGEVPDAVVPLLERPCEGIGRLSGLGEGQRVRHAADDEEQGQEASDHVGSAERFKVRAKSALPVFPLIAARIVAD
jgi:hypothetical protein